MKRGTWFALAFTLTGNALAQPIPMTDFECRQTLNQAFGRVRIVDLLHPTGYSFVLRMSAVQTLGAQQSNYVGLLRWYNDQTGTNELLRSELWTLRDSAAVHRLVADGRRVWSHFIPQREYTVSQYDGDTLPQSATYRVDFLNMFKNPVQGAASNLMALGGQIGLSGAARVQDWIGGIPFTGEEDPATHRRVIWQQVPNASWYVKFTCDPVGIAYDFVELEVYKADRVGTRLRETTSIIRIERDGVGVPVEVVRDSSDFAFMPPAGNRVLSTPRAIKF